MEYFDGTILNGVKVIRTWRQGSAIRGLFICPYCNTQFESCVGNVKNSRESKSCGCKTYERLSRGRSTHSLIEHKVYWVWKSMKQRCLNPNHSRYKDWGGRGIAIQENWVNDFKAFFDYVTSLPSYPGEKGLGKGEGKLSLDRVENNGNYEKGNLRWATIETQNNNQRARKPS